MGRKPKNKFIEASLVFKENSKVRRYDVKMPFLYSITLETTDPSSVNVQTTWEYYAKSASDWDAITKEIKDYPLGLKVIKIEQATRPHTDLCPRCHMRGVPKIEKKDTRDNRERSWRNKDETPRKERQLEFWLTYTHSRSKKCRICQYTNTPSPAYKQNKIEIEKYFFPHVLEHMKKGSVWYADQSQ